MVLQSLDPSDLHWHSTPRISTHPQPSRDGPCEIPHKANSHRETRFPLACMGQRLGWVRGSSAVAWPGHPDKAFTHPARGAAPRVPFLLLLSHAQTPSHHLPNNTGARVGPLVGNFVEHPPKQDRLLKKSSILKARLENKAELWFGTRSLPSLQNCKKQVLCNEGWLSYASW